MSGLEEDYSYTKIMRAHTRFFNKIGLIHVRSNLFYKEIDKLCKLFRKEKLILKVKIIETYL